MSQDTYDIWELWSEWLTDMTWQMTNTVRGRSLRLLAFATFDQSGEKTWPDLEKDSDKDKDNDNENDNNKYI